MAETGDIAGARDATLEPDSGLIRALSEGVGPRPPGSETEREAAELICRELASLGLEPRLEEFASQRSFGPGYLVIFGLSLLAAPLGRRFRLLGPVAALGAAALGLLESRFARRNPLHLLRRRESQNVWATIEPETASGRTDAGRVEQTICLVSHMDSSRSGLMFHPRVTPYLGRLQSASAAALLVNGLGPVLARLPLGRHLVRAARLMLGFSATMIAERELLGQEVAGANDNASGVAACLNLAGHFSENRLQHSRLVILVTGSEESGVIGMNEFLETHDTEGWLFINFDGVSAEAPLRVLSREGGPAGVQADEELLKAAADVGRRAPELAAEPLQDGSGLPYDATAVLLGGGRAISVVNQEGAIPDYHWPTDRADRVSEQAFSRAVRFGAALVRELDSGS